MPCSASESCSTIRCRIIGAGERKGRLKRRDDGRELSRSSCTGSYLGSVAGDEPVHGLVEGQLAHRGQHAKGIAAEQHDVPGEGRCRSRERVVRVGGG